MTYVELQACTHFSFLRGVSSAEEMFAAAALLGYPALGIADRNTVGGLVKALRAADETKVRLIAGCRLDLMDGTGLLVWPEDRPAWSRLARLLTAGKGRADRAKGEKGQCFLHWEDVARWSEGLVAALVPDEADAATETALAQMAEIFGPRAHLALSHRRRPGEAARLHALDIMARRFGVRGLATGDVLYDSPDRRMLQDVVTAIRHKCTIDDLGFRRELYADRHLKGPEEMERRFRDHPDAVRATAEVAERCTFSLRELSYQYPDEIVMSGRTPQEALERLTRGALAARFPEGPPPSHVALLEKELALVAKLEYAPYFLTVNSVVQFARSQEILCQGRGSAANSMICFVLGITSIDPVKHTLLFERFISESRNEPPDIDVDFEHERREEVIQWIYEHYGHSHAALTAVVSRYRTRGAVREVGKALGLPEDLTAMLSGQVWGWSEDGVPERHVDDLGLDRNDPRLALTLELTRQLVGTPRHLSQHPGGFVLTRDRLDDLVPIEPAAMVDRQVIEWEKDDLEELKIMKLDVLGLGMLGCMRRAFDLLREHKGIDMTLWDPILQEEDPAVFAMIRKADTIGTFQIESRAQMSMLPRMKPQDLLRHRHPGGDRPAGSDPGRHGPSLSEAPRGQGEGRLSVRGLAGGAREDAGRAALPGAGDERRHRRRRLHPGGGRPAAAFDGDVQVDRRGQRLPGQDDRGHGGTRLHPRLRRAHLPPDRGLRKLRLPREPRGELRQDRLRLELDEMPPPRRLLRGHPQRPADGLLPALPAGEGCRGARRGGEAGLHQRQPVGLHFGGGNSSPSLLGEGDQAKPGGGEGLTPNCPSTALSRGPPPRGKLGEELGKLLPLRLGLRMVRGLSNLHAAQILAARSEGPFDSIEDVWRRCGVPVAALEKLADADAFASLGLDRRQALWRVRGLGEAPLPLFAAADAMGAEPEVALVPLTGGREVVEDYRSVQLSLRGHPLAFLRPELERRRIVPCAALARLKDGARVEVAGLVLIRQRPGKGNVTFITLEDETRNRQRHPVAAPVRGAAADRDGVGDDRGEGADAEGGRASSTSSPTGSRT